VGTTVYADDGRAAWATVEKDQGFKIRYHEGDDWARVTEIPGIEGVDMSAYVPLSAITRIP